MSRIGVVGCGQMGSGIAQICALAGADVIVVDVEPSVAEAGRRRVSQSLARAVQKGRLGPDAASAAMAGLDFSSRLDDLADRELVIEAATENEALKRELFAAIDKVVEAPDAILASNTSSIPILRLATCTTRAAQVVGLHFFNPVPVLGLVEIIPSILTSPETLRHAKEFVYALGKRPVRGPDRPGFIVNALLIPYLLSAIRMLEAGSATKEDLDVAMELGCAHPMGPLRLCDLVGLDTVAAIARTLHEESGDPLHSPPSLLLRLTEAGQLGRKTGRGFYDYASLELR